MNFFGHNYVAYKVLGRNNSLVAAGSHVPDFVPFVPDSVFSFEEIHESPEIFFEFLKKNYPDKVDLALAMMAHSVKYGADKFNKVDEWLLDDKKEKEEIVAGIMDCSGVDFSVASGRRLHNYLWVGADIFLLEKHRDFVDEIKQLHANINREEVSTLLAECFGKDRKDVLRMTDYLFDQITQESFDSLEGYILTWKGFVEGLGEGDFIDIEKSEILFTKIYDLFSDKWAEIFERVINETRTNMEEFLEAI